MKNKRLVEIIKDPGTATEKEIKVIKTLSSDYSYSPFLKVLQARIDNLHDRKNKTKSLSRAAIYIADRSVLKHFIAHDQSTSIASIVPEKTSSVPEKNQKAKREEETTISTNIPADAVEEVIISSTTDIDQEAVVTEDSDSADKQKAKKEVAEDLDSTIAEKLDKVMEEKIEENVQEPTSTVTDTPDKQAEKKPAEELPVEENGKKAETVEEAVTGDTKEKEDIPKVVDIRDKIEEILHDEPKGKKSKKGEASEEEPMRSVSSEGISGEADMAKQSMTGSMKEAGDDALSSEIMKNISELKKHKASLFKILELESQEEGKHEKEKDGKSSHKKKSKKEKHHSKSREPQEPAAESGYGQDYPADAVDDESEQDYPDYEEADPKVIKDFLNKLEKENPPPKRKLKKEEQEALIEKFIKSDPTIKNVRSSKDVPDKKDLSLTSVKFRDDLISENLANIMVKQGKHDKAIDIYKKLIWKFPQKKAYFAAQIEELKKKSGN